MLVQPEPLGRESLELACRSGPCESGDTSGHMALFDDSVDQLRGNVSMGKATALGHSAEEGTWVLPAKLKPGFERLKTTVRDVDDTLLVSLAADSQRIVSSLVVGQAD